MQMKLMVTGQGTSPATLQVSLFGYTLELSGVAPGRRVAICEEAGRVSVSLEEPQAVSEAQPAGEAQPEAAQAPEQEQVPAMEAPAEPEAAVVRPEPAGAVTAEQLFQRLVALRKQIAAEAKLPPYVIFHDITLKEMCRLLPADLQALKAVQGVGAAKLEKYGMRFIEAIRLHTVPTKGAA